MNWLRKNVGLIRDWFRCQLNYWLFFHRLVKNKQGLHLGCGWTRIGSLINLDLYPTKATDMLWDCRRLNKFFKSNFEIVYANALLEHLTPKEAFSFINQCRQVLSKKGRLIITGIPDFEKVAGCFLTKQPGIISQTFDLTTVMRYVYGWAGIIEAQTTETAKKMYSQHHQSLYDANLLKNYLTSAKFRSWTIFRYAYKEEKLPVNLGLIAGKQFSDRIPPNQINKIINQYSPGHIQTKPTILDEILVSR